MEVEAITEKVFLKTCFERSYGYKWVKTKQKRELKIEGRNWNWQRLRDENKYVQPINQHLDEYLPQARSCIRSTGIKRDKWPTIKIQCDN